MYETVLDYKSMSEAYEALKSVEAGSRSKYTKEGYVSIICNFLGPAGLIIFIPEDEMIKDHSKTRQYYGIQDPEQGKLRKDHGDIGGDT